MVSGQDGQSLLLFNFPKQKNDETKLKLLSEGEFQPHPYQPSQSTTKGVQPAKLCAKLHCLLFQPSLDLYALWQNSFEIPLRDSTLTSIGRPVDHTALLPKVIGCQIGNCHCLSKCTGGGKHAQRERGREKCKKEALVETMFRLRLRFPSSLLAPPLLLMSGLRRQQQRNRVRSVASAQAAAGSNERLLARDFQRAQLAPASRWDSFFPRPTLHNSRP